MTIDSVVKTAIGFGSVGRPTTQAWQDQYRAGFVDDLTKKNSDREPMSRSDRLLWASVMAKRIFEETGDIECCALLAKHSQCIDERAKAINILAKYIKRHHLKLKKLPISFLLFSVASWADVPFGRGMGEKIMQVDSELSRRTLYYRRNAVRAELQKMLDSVMTKLDITLEVC